MSEASESEPGPAAPREWDGAVYDRVSDPQLSWAGAILDRLDLRGDETVLDAGCGSGRVTELLLERLPLGRVIAVDGSRSMLERAVERFASQADRVELIHADLLALDLGGATRVDAIFSNAVFHWITDHGALFERLAACLEPGGQLEAQCGGRGNVARFKAIAEVVIDRSDFADSFAAWHRPWLFAGPEETTSALRGAGFIDVSCDLEERPARPADLGSYLRAVCLGPYLERLPEQQREPFAAAVTEAMEPDAELDYVRLNISARRASG